MTSLSENLGAPLDEDATKKARLEFRSTQTQKTIIERAASLLGESVTSFVLSTVLRDAVKVINDHQVTELSLRDWARFEAILENDEEPNRHLTDATRRYQQRVIHSDGF